MKQTYCGACHGERGCADCRAVGKSVVYTGLTEFVAEDALSEVGCAETTEQLRSKSETVHNEFFLAADLGTTTLAFVCANEQGEVLASYGTENPQRRVAADVIGRIDAALHGQSESLTKQIREALVKGFLFVFLQGMRGFGESKINEEKITIRIALAGNTTMQHLLMGYPVEGMAKAPFAPHSLKEERFCFKELFAGTAGYEELPELIRQAETVLLPGFSAFVGGDIAAGATMLFHGREDETSLLIDLGTNGELLLSYKGRLYGTAAAMGSAFEGGRYAYASELFRLIAQALTQRCMDETGLLCEPYFTEGFQGLLQEDVREFQLAKGAIRAGIELLCKYAGVDVSDVERVFVAGGVGQFCREEDLLATGLLPRTFEGKIKVVGNSCVGGMLFYLKNKESMIYCKGEILNPAEMPEFAEVYYRCMNFEAEQDRKDG